MNVRAIWLLSRAALPHMRKAGGGSIINVASTLGIVGARNRAAYATSKGAVVLLRTSVPLTRRLSRALYFVFADGCGNPRNQSGSRRCADLSVHRQ